MPWLAPARLGGSSVIVRRLSPGSEFLAGWWSQGQGCCWHFCFEEVALSNDLSKNGNKRTDLKARCLRRAVGVQVPWVNWSSSGKHIPEEITGKCNVIKHFVVYRTLGSFAGWRAFGCAIDYSNEIYMLLLHTKQYIYIYHIILFLLLVASFLSFSLNNRLLSTYCFKAPGDLRIPVGEGDEAEGVEERKVGHAGLWRRHHSGYLDWQRIPMALCREERFSAMRPVWVFFS